MKLPKEISEEAKELNLDVKDYLNAICDEQFGMNYEEAAKQGLVEEYEFEGEELRVDLGDIDITFFHPDDIKRALQFLDKKDSFWKNHAPTESNRNAFKILYGNKAFLKWMSDQ